MPKEIFKKSRMYRTLKREIEIHKQLKHDYIVRLYTNLEDQHFYYLVMEYIPKDNLFNAIRKYHLIYNPTMRNDHTYTSRFLRNATKLPYINI